MAKRITLQTPSIAANTTVSMTNVSTDFVKLKTDTDDRMLIGIGFAGATVNTGTLFAYVGNEEIYKTMNGVTNTAGAVVRQDDVTTVNEIIGANENFDIQISNTTGGALQFYIYLEFSDE